MVTARFSGRFLDAGWTLDPDGIPTETELGIRAVLAFLLDVRVDEEAAGHSRFGLFIKLFARESGAGGIDARDCVPGA